MQLAAALALSALITFEKHTDRWPQQIA